MYRKIDLPRQGVIRSTNHKSYIHVGELHWMKGHETRSRSRPTLENNDAK
jgi:hypothetical protein